MTTSTEDTEILHTSAFLFPEIPEPFSSRVEVDFGARTDIGKSRSANEDSYLISKTGRFWQRLHTSLDGQLPGRFEENGYLLAVADGMGGHRAGEVASTLALRTAVALILNAAQWALKLDNPEQREQEVEEVIARGVGYFRKIHQTVSIRAREDPSLARMGTTLTAAYSFGTDLFVLHVGDSRAYLFRGGELRQLTRDHTMAQHLVEMGDLSREQARRHRLSHVLTRSIGGGGSEAQVDVTHNHLADGDTLLVCSDGLTGMLPDARITEVLARGGNAQATCEELVEEALSAGGKDNITVLVARYRFPERE